ncbi:primosomal protein N' [Fibrobacter sp. UWB10]|uniref:replication restart helicase PriA n=1 Tax=Fibrobacter sp. UWB10 TaxID=1896201 RepID=UPI00240392F7|nr:primosomal protein N' [Fibrobacter sp. UWB10]SMP39029.1 replication restart DNA helicase PriA [Fibrobacter sp. UWB10]
MTKRIPKLSAPEEVHQKIKSELLTDFCEVYIPMAPDVYTYGVPAGYRLTRGDVVWVQFATRKKPALAVVSKVHQDRPKFDVRPAYPHQSGYRFSERYMEMLEWTARYYISTPMKALFVFWPSDFEKYLDALAFTKGEASPSHEPQGSPATPSAGSHPATPPNAQALTLEQTNAFNTLCEELNKTGFRGVLLHGVTGSGKTRVYQELALEALKQNKKVLILVPEIGLTPQTRKRFEDFLQVPIVVLHSALSAPKKREGYVSILKGDAQVVLGTRSAILAPFDFDLVILDEEHDTSFKQQDPAPRYHTREMAFHLAYKYGALVVLGSATPCLETFYNAQAKNLKIVTLKERATQAPLPKVQIVDMGKMRQQKGILLSPTLREALTDCIEKGDQAIILMNRRGFSKMRVCTECGETLYCKHCHIPLVYHKQYRSLMCHYCAALYPVNTPCSACGAETYEFVGGAIEMLEDEIKEWIPNAKVIRMDRDTTQNVGASEKILDAFRNREYNILIGTQMVAKGHDFPGVQLVGVVGADSGLGIPDFRSTERLFQLLSQTAGRAGRAGGEGQVLIQTLKPSEPIMQFAVNHDYNGFANKEMEDRRAAFYPPFCKLVEISCGSRDEDLLRHTVERLEALLRANKNLMVLGPVDAFVPVVQNVHWAKLYIKTQDLAPVRKVLYPIINAPKPWVQNIEIKVEIE